MFAVLQASVPASLLHDRAHDPQEGLVPMDDATILKECVRCEGKFPATKEYFFSKKPGHLRPRCKSCHKKPAAQKEFGERISVRKRFWAKVDKEGPEPKHVAGIGNCWTWIGSKNDQGYGKFRFRGNDNHRAHRLAYELANGVDPGLCAVLHRCDNTSCVRPDHLRLGSQLDNIGDCCAKGRNARGSRSGRNSKPEKYPIGERHPFAKLNRESVAQMRALYAAGHGTIKAIAERFGVGYCCAQSAISRRTWAHVE